MTAEDTLHILKAEFKEFVNLAEQVRQTQNEYFRTRNNNSLTAARQLEKKLDAEIKRIKGGKYSGKITMF